MIKDRSELKNYPIEIDLSGPDGNAFVLLGIAQRSGKQLGMNKEKIQSIIADMNSSDYDHLIKVFDNHFGDFYTLYK